MKICAKDKAWWELVWTMFVNSVNGKLELCEDVMKKMNGKYGISRSSAWRFMSRANLLARIGIEGAILGQCSSEMFKMFLGYFECLDDITATKLLDKIGEMDIDIIKVMIDAMIMRGVDKVCDWSRFMHAIDKRTSVLLYVLRVVKLRNVFCDRYSSVYFWWGMNNRTYIDKLNNYFRMACEAERVEVVETMIKHVEGDVGTYINTALKIACSEGHMKLLERMVVVAAWWQLRYVWCIDWNKLATYACDVRVLKFVVEHGASDWRLLYKVHSVLNCGRNDYEWLCELCYGKIEYLMKLEGFDFGYAIMLERSRIEFGVKDGDEGEMHACSMLNLLETNRIRAKRRTFNMLKYVEVDDDMVSMRSVCSVRNVRNVRNAKIFSDIREWMMWREWEVLEICAYSLVPYCSLYDEIFMYQTSASMFRTRGDMRKRLALVMPCASVNVIEKRLKIRKCKRDKVICAMIMRYVEYRNL